MSINWSAIEGVVAKGLTLVQEIAPMAAVAGPLGVEAASVAGKVAAFASAALTAAQNEQAVISATDLASLSVLQKQIQDANDELAAQIAAS
jgi:hypothetical protein